LTTFGIDRTTGSGGSGTSTTTLLADGSQPLTADWNAGSFDITALSFYASGTSPVFSLNRALNSQDNAVVFNEADGSARWRLTHVGTTDAFALQRYNASGVLQDSPISVSNSDGKVTLTGDLVFGGIVTGDTFIRRNAGNTAWEAKTPQQVADEIGLLGKGYVFIESKSASTSSSLDFDSASYADYEWIEFRLSDVLPATDAANLVLRGSTDGGSTYVSSTDYQYAGSNFNTTPGTNGFGSSGSSGVVVAINMSNASGGFNGVVRVRRTGLCADAKGVYYAGGGGSLLIHTQSGGARFGSTYDAFRFLLSSGNITSGTIRAYGLKA
jgi:hypothetical protein